MNIAQALKKKNRLQGELSELFNSYLVSNRTIVGNNDIIEKSNDIYIKIKNMIDEISNLKAQIAKATYPVAQRINKMSYLKELLKHTKSLEIESKAPRYNVDVPEICYDVSINDTKKKQYISDLNKQINDIQDELDDYNASTQV